MRVKEGSVVEFDARLGEDITDCIGEAIHVAYWLHIPVRFSFNGVKITVTDASCAVGLYHKYQNAKEGDAIC